MPDLVVDSNKLRGYVQRLGKVNLQLTRLDWRLKTLYTKVGLLDLYPLIQADSVTGPSVKLLRVQAYLEVTALDFEQLEKKLLSLEPLCFVAPPSINPVQVFYDVGNAARKRADEVRSFWTDVLSDAIYSYNSHGIVYDIVEYGKAAIKVGKGVKKVIIAGGALIGSGGLATPVAVVVLISGINDIYNGTSDVVHVYNDEYDEVGKNLLKDTLVKNGGEIGEFFGNREAGETFGRVTYFGVDLVSTLVTLDMTLDKIKQCTSISMPDLGTELKTIGGMDVSSFMTTDFESLRYTTKLASYAFPEITNAVSTAGLYKDVGLKAVHIYKEFKDVITVSPPAPDAVPIIRQWESAKDMVKELGKDAIFSGPGVHLASPVSAAHFNTMPYGREEQEVLK